MKVKKVLAGLQQEYDLEEIHIITPTKVVYSGTVKEWVAASVEMALYKKQIENLEVVDRMMFNGRKAFLFVPEIGDYYPPKD